MAIEDAEGELIVLPSQWNRSEEPSLPAIGVAFEHLISTPQDPSYIPRILKQVQNVRYDRVSLIQACSRSALNHHFKLPPGDNILETVAGGDPMVAMAKSFVYNGAREWATANGIDFPGVEHGGSAA